MVNPTPSVSGVCIKHKPSEFEAASWGMRTIYALNFALECVEGGYRLFEEKMSKGAFRLYTYLFGEEKRGAQKPKQPFTINLVEGGESKTSHLVASPIQAFLSPQALQFYQSAVLPFMVGMASPGGSLVGQNLILQRWRIHESTKISLSQPSHQQNANLAKTVVPSLVIGKGCQLFEAASGMPLPTPIKGGLLVLTSLPQVQEGLATNSITGPLINAFERGLNWTEEGVVAGLSRGYTKLVFYLLRKGAPHLQAELATNFGLVGANKTIALDGDQNRQRGTLTKWMIDLAKEGVIAEATRTSEEVMANSVIRLDKLSAEATTRSFKMFILQYIAFFYARKGSKMGIRDPLWVATLVVGSLAAEKSPSEAAFKVGSLGILYRTRSPALAAFSYMMGKLALFVTTLLMRGHYHQMLRKGEQEEEFQQYHTRSVTWIEPNSWTRTEEGHFLPEREEEPFELTIGGGTDYGWELSFKATELMQ